MDSNRYYQYLNHSQSPLRVNQFWFYHHEPGLNRSFDEAYKLMGKLDRERNVAKNNDARNLLDEKLSNWFLPYGEKIDSIREPFFRQLLIAACLSSVRELLRRTRIRVSLNKARNMFGIIDEYNLLKPDEVFIQYTRLNDHEDKEKNDKCQNTRILSNCKVVITKNPCHHPGDIQTFTAVNREELKHLKDVIVFSQPGDCPASHQINESDLNGDEYAVIWYEDLVPLQIPNAVPFDYDSQKALPELDRPVNQDDINHVVLQIAESDYLGRLPNLHLAYTDSYGVDSNERPNKDVLSTLILAGVISFGVDSGQTGQHPLDNNQIRKQKKALRDERPDFMENANMKSYPSKKYLINIHFKSILERNKKENLKYNGNCKNLEISLV
ncbi:unnamed protein product [Rotaria sp. Silwood1]|nr:unnamed protein product [Rotaria sp. Silwood1]